MRVLGYIRVSTEEQRDGEAAQRADIEAWAKRHHPGKALRLYRDVGVSGGLIWNERPALSTLMTDIEAGDVLVVTRRDRLSRNVLNACVLEQMIGRVGAALACTDGTPSGDEAEAVLMRRILDAFAEFERAMISLRTKRAAQLRRDRGYKTNGTCPFGTHAKKGRLEYDATEMEALRVLMALRAEGVSFRVIAETLDARGLHARNGKPWLGQTLHRIYHFWVEQGWPPTEGRPLRRKKEQPT